MCPKCGARMFSEWCWACASEWVPRTYCRDLPLPELERKHYPEGMGSRCLASHQLEEIKNRLVFGKRGTRSQLAREFGVGVATLTRISREMRSA